MSAIVITASASIRGGAKKLSGEEFDAFESPIDTEYFGIASAIVVLKKACVVAQAERIIGLPAGF